MGNGEQGNRWRKEVGQWTWPSDEYIFLAEGRARTGFLIAIEFEPKQKQFQQEPEQQF